MFKKILTAVLTVSAFTAVTVEAASLNVGYSYGQIAETGISKVGKGDISGAIELSGEMLGRYVGGKVTGVKVGLVTSEGVTDLKGWVRSGLEEENLTFGEAVAITDGWNDIRLDGNLEIDGSSLVVGFTFTQEKGIKCISLVGDDQPGAKWIAKNGKWDVYDKIGALSVELVISSDDFPACDLLMQKIESPEMPVSTNEDACLKAIVRNIGSEPVKGFEIEYNIDGSDGSRIACDRTLQYGEMAEVLVTVRSDEVTADESHEVGFKIVCPEDGYAENDYLPHKISFYTQSLPRRVLVEEFTSEECINCPRAIMALEQCLNAGYGESMSIVAHHVGYKTDWLTLEEDKEYSEFFNIHSAPSGMLDRRVMEDTGDPVFAIGNFSQFGPLVEAAMARPAFVSLDVKPSLDDDELNVQVDIHRLPVFEATCREPRLTVYVIESGIPHHHQAGIESDTFTHSHVIRKHLTDAWGDLIEWNGDDATITVSCIMDGVWNAENMEVVAFVNEYDPESVARCNVYNSAITSVLNASVDQIEGTEGIKEITYYTLDGRMLSESPEKGMCICKTLYCNGKVRYNKILF